MDAVARKKAIDDAAAAATEAAHAITVEVNSNETKRIETKRNETKRNESLFPSCSGFPSTISSRTYPSLSLYLHLCHFFYESRFV